MRCLFLSTQVTRWPMCARQAPVVSPTYPVPITPTLNRTPEAFLELILHSQSYSRKVLMGTVAEQDSLDGASQYNQVQPDRPAAHVGSYHLDSLFMASIVTPAYLP